MSPSHSLLTLALAGLFAAHAQTTLTLTPQPITQCNDRGQGTAQLSWRSPVAAVQVRIGSPAGPAMTGFEPANGGVTTGDWVSDGLVFVLVDTNGHELARATASVLCRARSASLNEQLATQPYLPLEVGNRWVYRFSDRFLTAHHRVRWVDRTVEEGGETWFVLRDQVAPGAPISETLWRTDGNGRIFRRRNHLTELFLDPQASPDSAAIAQIRQRDLTVSTAFGPLSNALTYSARQLLSTQTGTLARGVGWLLINDAVDGGSSGGFVAGFELVEAVIAGQIRLSSPANGLELSPESQSLDLTGRKVRNCALPCYFAACGLAGGPPDPVGTYKPCISTRLKVAHPAVRSLSLELLDPGGVAVHTVTRPLAASPSELLWFETVPLYTAPAIQLPAGLYQLRATAKSASGEILNTGSASLTIQ